MPVVGFSTTSPFSSTYFIFPSSSKIIGKLPLCDTKSVLNINDAVLYGTYSYTLTESLSTGVPVLASDIGALKFRIERDGGGWLIDYTNPKSTYNKILEIAKDTNEYKRVKKEVDLIKTTTIEEMGNNYKKLYENLE